MHRLLVVLAVILTAGSAAASDKTDVMAVVNQFMDGFNKGDTKTALAACAAQTAIIDDFPPYTWQGATGCSDWANDFEAFGKKHKVTSPVVTLGKPRHVEVTEDRAYVVVPATYKYKEDGKPKTESGATFTVALQKVAAGWRITGWSWAKP